MHILALPIALTLTTVPPPPPQLPEREPQLIEVTTLVHEGRPASGLEGQTIKSGAFWVEILELASVKGIALAAHVEPGQHGCVWVGEVGNLQPVFHTSLHAKKLRNSARILGEDPGREAVLCTTTSSAPDKGPDLWRVRGDSVTRIENTLGTIQAVLADSSGLVFRSQRTLFREGTSGFHPLVPIGTPLTGIEGVRTAAEATWLASEGDSHLFLAGLTGLGADGKQALLLAVNGKISTLLVESQRLSSGETVAELGGAALGPEGVGVVHAKLGDGRKTVLLLRDGQLSLGESKLEHRLANTPIGMVHFLAKDVLAIRGAGLVDTRGEWIAREPQRGHRSDVRWLGQGQALTYDVMDNVGIQAIVGGPRESLSCLLRVGDTLVLDGGEQRTIKGFPSKGVRRITGNHLVAAVTLEAELGKHHEEWAVVAAEVDLAGWTATDPVALEASAPTDSVTPLLRIQHKGLRGGIHLKPGVSDARLESLLESLRIALPQGRVRELGKGRYVVLLGMLQHYYFNRITCEQLRAEIEAQEQRLADIELPKKAKERARASLKVLQDQLDASSRAAESLPLEDVQDYDLGDARISWLAKSLFFDRKRRHEASERRRRLFAEIAAGKVQAEPLLMELLKDIEKASKEREWDTLQLLQDQALEWLLGCLEDA